MTDQEVKKLNRKDLLDMLLEQSKELAATKEKLEQAEQQLSKREIEIDEAGSIAEAALQLNGLFDAAQEACKQYTDNIQRLSEKKERVCMEAERESKETAERLVTETKLKCQEMEQTTEKKCRELELTTTMECNEKTMRTKIQCEEMVQKAKEESESYWKEVHEKLETFYQQHESLQSLLSAMVYPKQ